MGALQHRVFAVLAMDAAGQRAHPDRHREQSPAKWLRDSIDVVGHAFFLLPLCIVMVITGIPFFLKSFAINEQSWNAGGLPQWPSKALVMTAFAFLFVQGLSELVKRIAVMRNLIPDPHAGQRSSLETEAEEVMSAIEKH